MAAIAEVANGREAFTEERGVLRAVLAAAQSLDLYAEISADGRGAGIHHAIATQGSVSIKDFVSWICLEKKCSRVRCFSMWLVSSHPTVGPGRRVMLYACFASLIRICRFVSVEAHRIPLFALAIWGMGRC